MSRQPEKIIKAFLLLSLIEGIIVAVILLLIPPDPKNAFLFGYSKSRLVLLAGTLILLAAFGAALFSKNIHNQLTKLLAPSSPLARVLPWVGGVMMLLLWLIIWIPAYRLEEQSANFTRLQPLLIWIGLIVVQGALAVWLIAGPKNIKPAFEEMKGTRKWLYYWAGIFVLTVIIFLVLLLAGGTFPGRQLYFPPGVPLSALQVILAWLVFLLLFLLENRLGARKTSRKWVTTVVFVLIWATTFIAWFSVPIPCTDDRPGPYPPNNVCYPNVNDAMYNIGSHYITLGQGIYNHWLTDKPLYLAFLAFGQGVAGPEIDNYLAFQVAVIAFIPALLYLAGKKKYGNAFGVFLAILTALQGLYAITLYREIGSVNVKLENPEVVTALFLVLFSFAAFKWLVDPTITRWAILSGGLLGLSVLLRFNPLFIAPFLLIAVFLAAKKKFREVLPGILLFILAFFLAFGPWFLTATDENGKNHYFTKIEEVISSRFSSRQDSGMQVLPSAAPGGTQPQPDDGSAGIPPGDEMLEEELLNYELGEIDKAGLSGIVYHFLNNVYTGLAKLPTTLILHPIGEQVTDGIWTFTEAEPIWMKHLRVENLLALAISLALVLTGIMTAWKRFGIAGLTGIIIQAGYYAGNAFSQTSGGRYLEPVFWILIVYYCLGIYTLTLLGIKAFSTSKFALSTETEVLDKPDGGSSHQGRKWVNPVLLAGFLAFGMILPALDLLPEKLPEENNPGVEEKVFELLSQRGLVTEDQWSSFLQDENAIVIQGSAFNPRYYRGNFYRAGNLSFELMVLAKEHVVVGYSPGIIPVDPFSDGSDVILVGCGIANDTLWGANRVIVESIAVIQLDNEQAVLFDDEMGWGCSR